MQRQPLSLEERLAAVLIVLSFVLYAALLGVPLVAGSASAGAAYGTALVAGGEVSFWVGAAIGGPGLVRRFRSGRWRRPQAS